MIRFELLFGVLTLALWIFSLVEVISTDESRMRHLPKLWWLLIVLFFPLAGSIAWLLVGRPVPAAGSGSTIAFPDHERPGRFAATVTDPAQDEDFLRKVRERAEEQRRVHRERQQRETDPPPGP